MTADLFAWGAAWLAEENAPGLVRAYHPDTSIEAANAIAPEGRHRLCVGGDEDLETFGTDWGYVA